MYQVSRSIVQFACGSITALCLASTSGHAAVTFHEDFSGDLSTWTIKNASDPVGATSWQIGGVSDLARGGSREFAAANFDAAGESDTTATISLWLISPAMALHNGDVIQFVSRAANQGDTPFPDRLQLRLNGVNAGTNVGDGALTVGDFGALLLDINPTYAGPPDGYPLEWTDYSATIGGLAANGMQGRFALRYFVEDGGPLGQRGSEIGVDDVTVTSSVPEPSTVVGLGTALLAVMIRRPRRESRVAP